KAPRIFAFLRDDNRRDALECADLPVDVPHLGLQKRRAITGDGGRRVRRSVQLPKAYANGWHSEMAMTNDECLMTKRMFERWFRHFHSAVVVEDAEWPPRKRATQIKSKHNFEEL